MDVASLQFDSSTKMGDIRKIAKEIKIDHELALELWSTSNFHERLLALLIMDKKCLSTDLVDKLVHAMTSHDDSEQVQLMDWLFANQLSKTKNGIEMMLSWQNSKLPLQRRTYWYYQARLRWTGKGGYENTDYLLTEIENHIINEVPMVQWAMNFLAGWIGVYEREFRNRCVKLGEQTGLYKGQKVSRGCTPDYLPEFIRMESEKRNL